MRQIGGVQADTLLLSVAEQLKEPLTIIARQAELGQLTGQVQLVDAHTIRTQAAAALSLVESYLLGLELMKDQAQLQLEPVSISSLFADVAHDLSRFAKHYGVELELIMAGKYGPVMSHARGLKAAMLSIGFTLVEAQAAQPERRPKRLTLAVHNNPHGIVAGMYGEYQAVNADTWRTALALAGRARQPFTAAAGAGGAGLFVADAILRSMQSHLRVGKYQHQSGLATTLQASQQMQLV